MRTKGFNLIEIMIVIGIMAVLATLSLAIYDGFFSMSELDDFEVQAIQDLRQARDYSRAGYDDSSYGIYFDLDTVPGSKIVFYQGNSYAGRQAGFDRITVFDKKYISSTSLETISENSFDINFSKYQGIPDNTGNIIVDSGKGIQKTININQLGLIAEAAD